MKNIFRLLTILFGLTFLIQSCKKGSLPEPMTQTINQTLRANQSYQFDLGSFGDEEGASISKQATNFSISSVNKDINTGKAIYKYVPATNFIGTDEVEIKSARGSNGTCANKKLINITIKFTITK